MRRLLPPVILAAILLQVISVQGTVLAAHPDPLLDPLLATREAAGRAGGNQGGATPTPPAEGIAPEAALVMVAAPAPETVARLLDQGIMVVRNLDTYLLVVAGDSEMARMDALGVEYAVLDRPIDGRTYYTVGVRDADKFAGVSAHVRVLSFDGREAVVEASPEEAEKIAGAGLEIARVFLRSVRLAPEEKVVEIAPLVQADPSIQAMVDAVSGSQIDAGVQRLQNFVTRYATHDSCQAAANWIKAKFESYGIDSVYFHHYSASYKDNVVAVIPGVADPSKIVVIGGHYDSYTSTPSNCPGADDNASGTVCALECARILSQYEFNYTLAFIAFGGEEMGLIGSEAYAAEAAARGDDIIGMVAVDMIGYLAGGDAMDLDIIDNASSVWMRDLVMDVGSLYVPGFSVVDGSIPGGASSDHASFWDHGYDALLFFEDTGSYSPYIHSTSDVVGTSYNSPTLARNSVKVAVAMIATLAEPFRVAIAHTPLGDTEDTQNPYRVVADILAAGTLDTDSSVVYYSTGEGFSALPMSPTGNPDEYEAFIPAQPGGTWVDYYIRAEDTQGNHATSPSGAPGQVHTFFVGVKTVVVSHDFETDHGWTVGDTGDNATTGIWERCDPQATAAQPEDDHTPAPGVKAYITACAAGTSQGSYDVDGGKTTLKSPIFDLSDDRFAHVKYYRWFSNDTGSNPETDTWVVDVSDDGGSTWVRLETLPSSDRTWRLVERDITDYVELTSQVRFRFIASDDVNGSIVEAGVDDFSIITYEDALASVRPGDGGDPGRLVLAPNVPNPFAGETRIRFSVPAPGRSVTLAIFDVAGRRVRTLLRDERVAGSMAVRWDGTNDEGARVAAGVYFSRLEAGKDALLRKVILAR